MTRKKVDSSLERQFLTAMITSKAFLGALAPILDLSLLQTPYLKQLATWCVKFFNDYGDAPGKQIESLFHAWAENESPEEADVDSIGDFLSSLSGEFDEASPINVPFLLDEVSTYLTLKRVALLKDNLTSHMLYGKKEDALTAISSFRTIDLGGDIGFNPITSTQVVTEAFADVTETVVPFPGEAGAFLNPGFTRDSLVGVQGPEKRGKTFWCLEFAYRAICDRQRVAVFEVGDLSKKQLTKRWLVRMAGTPLWDKQCSGVMVPRKIELVEGAEGKMRPEVESYKKKYSAPLNEGIARASQKLFRRRHRLPKDKDYLRFSVHANSSINVKGIDSILRRWRQEDNFIPDVIIIDYADILASEDTKKEARDQINDTWKALRRLSQEWHACVIAPTQANAASYDVHTQSMKNFSNDKRKLAHVTGMLGLNQTSEEKKLGVMRLNWIVLRESEFHASECLWVAQCLPLAMAFCCATR